MNAAIAFSQGSSLEHLSDAELLRATRSLVGRSNQLLAALLAHLAEVEARGVHRTRACGSLYTYCIYELRFSEDEAYRRVTAARLVRRFPVLLEAVASGELHLTGVVMLGPHLTEANLSQVLARAKHRTKKELLRLVRALNPLPEAPPLIEPLGPVTSPAAGGGQSSPSHPPLSMALRNPTWQEFADSFSPVRNLLPGDRPRDWMSPDPLAEEPEVNAVSAEADVPPAVPTPQAEPMSLEPQRYRVQFTAGEEYVKLVDEAKALLSHASARGLEELHLRAMRAFVAELKKQKYAVGARARKSPAPAHSGEAATPTQGREGPLDHGEAPHHGEAPRQHDELPRQRGTSRSRHVPASVRRAVFERDGGRCTYVDESGQRCRETHRLELHHLEPFALDGAHSERNVTLRCYAHNQLAAEQDFGREFVEQQRGAARYESFCQQKLGE